jgi:hypothetical protein
VYAPRTIVAVFTPCIVVSKYPLIVRFDCNEKRQAATEKNKTVQLIAHPLRLTNVVPEAVGFIESVPQLNVTLAGVPVAATVLAVTVNVVTADVNVSVALFEA